VLHGVERLGHIVSIPNYISIADHTPYQCRTGVPRRYLVEMVWCTADGRTASSALATSYLEGPYYQS
jgi:hypothetical protein